MSLGGNGKHEEGHRRAGGFRGGPLRRSHAAALFPEMQQLPGWDCCPGSGDPPFTSPLPAQLPTGPARVHPAPIQRTVFHRRVQAQPYLKECENG